MLEKRGEARWIRIAVLKKKKEYSDPSQRRSNPSAPLV
jgi:hypothetical protein